MARNSSPTAPLRRARCETVNPLHVLSHSPVSYDTIPQTTPDTSSLYQSYSRLRRHPDRGWLCSLTRDQQYRRAAHTAHHHHHLLNTDLRVQMPIPLHTDTNKSGGAGLCRKKQIKQTRGTSLSVKKKEKERKQTTQIAKNLSPKGGIGGRHAATTQGF